MFEDTGINFPSIYGVSYFLFLSLGGAVDRAARLSLFTISLLDSSPQSSSMVVTATNPPAHTPGLLLRHGLEHEVASRVGCGGGGLRAVTALLDERGETGQLGRSSRQERAALEGENMGSHTSPVPHARY